MAIVNSCARVRGPVVAFFPGRLTASSRLPAFADIDSTNAITPRVELYTQRSGANIGDVAGRIYNTNGAAITLVGAEYSQVSSNGPWLPITLLSLDPAYSFPTHGSPIGEVFNIPIEISDEYVGYIWVKITINSGVFGDAVHANGAFDFAYVEIAPAAPGFVIVPSETKTGAYVISWGAISKATNYELQEAIDSGFGTAKPIYNGPDTSFRIQKRESGTFYYRVRAWRV